MNPDWNATEPIYLQLKERILAMILESTLNDGDALPSVRQVAADYQINPLTVLKAYQLLVDQDLVEKRRGLGMFVRMGVSRKLARSKREEFLGEEWPRIVKKIRRLGLDPAELMQHLKRKP